MLLISSRPLELSTYVDYRQIGRRLPNKLDCLLSIFGFSARIHIRHLLRTKLTILVFASDERAAMTSAAQIITSFEAKADYVIVKNPAGFRQCEGASDAQRV